jgi:DNA invertase Pin-like site-specific DNA recombinase
MANDVHQKVRPTHVQRNAYLYVRQSTLRQVFENTESTKRQYALKQRAVALGWPQERIVVLDTDLGQSGAASADREGFQKLVTEVGLGRAGLVMGLEVSRLARNSADWHRLLEMCALSDTLILDEDGIYDPAHFNDRLLLGLKGTMSEAELHILRARLLGGIISKARRAELQCPLPIGFVYDAAGNVVLDPDQQVKESIRTFFRTFRRMGSATATVKAFRNKGLLFPRRTNNRQKGDLAWGSLLHHRALWLLHNPRFAGVFFFGRTRQRKRGSNVISRKLPREEWVAFVPNAHPGYISWDEFEQNQKCLNENSAAHGSDLRKSPPREGPALLQGVAICGVCGRRMTVRYHGRKQGLQPDYLCQREGIERAERVCQHIPGASIDNAVGDLLVEAVSPMALEVTLAVQQELQTSLNEADALRKKHVERAQYEAELARRRFMSVDPENRLVAASLEAEWNEKLHVLDERHQEYPRECERDRKLLDEHTRARVIALASDFPKIWQDPRTEGRDRKRMLRLMIEDVTLLRDKEISVSVRFRGGATRTLTLPLPPPAWKIRQTSPEVLAEINRLLDNHTDSEIAVILTERGCRSGEGKSIDHAMVYRLRREHAMKTRYQRLRDAGMLTINEVAAKLGINPGTAKKWKGGGYLHAHWYNDHCYLIEPPGNDTPLKHKRKPGCYRSKAERVTANCA